MGLGLLGCLVAKNATQAFAPKGFYMKRITFGLVKHPQDYEMGESFNILQTLLEFFRSFNLTYRRTDSMEHIFLTFGRRMHYPYRLKFYLYSSVSLYRLDHIRAHILLAKTSLPPLIRPNSPQKINTPKLRPIHI